MHSGQSPCKALEGTGLPQFGQVALIVCISPGTKDLAAKGYKGKKSVFHAAASVRNR